MTQNEIYEYGREIVQAISQNDIPYTDKKKCQEFNLTINFPAWSQISNNLSIWNKDPKNYSHIDLSWSAQPKKGSSIIWTNIKRIRTSDLDPLIQSIKRDKKLCKLLA